MLYIKSQAGAYFKCTTGLNALVETMNLCLQNHAIGFDLCESSSLAFMKVIASVNPNGVRGILYRLSPERPEEASELVSLLPKFLMLRTL